MAYNRYPAVDEDNNFAPSIRRAIALSPELQQALKDLKARRVLDVKQFGAKGDGTADDFQAITDALTAAQAVGGDVFMPAGIYKTSKSIGAGTVGYTGVHLYGDGQQATRIKASANVPVISGAWYHCEIDNLILDASGLGSACVSAHLDKTTLDNLQLYGWNGAAMVLNDGTFGDIGLLNRIQRCNIDQNNGYGILTSYRFVDSWIVGNNIGSSKANLSIEGGPLRILDNHLDGAPEINIELRGNHRITINNNILEGARKQAIVYTMPPWLTSDDAAQIQIVGNAISNGGKAEAGVYPAIEIIGVSADARAQGFSVTGNIFACEDPGSGWNYCVRARFGKSISLVGNQWPTGHTEPYPFAFSSVSGQEVVGNHGDNGPVPETSGQAHTTIDDIYQLRSELAKRPVFGTDGKIKPEDLPPLAINDIWSVTSEAAMLALTAQKGDMAVRTDANKTFILGAEPATTLANWVQIVVPAGGITTVNGRSGPAITGLAEQSAVDQLSADLQAGLATRDTAINNRELLSNKSDDGLMGGTAPSSVKFPTQSAVKRYVDSTNSGAGGRTSNSVTSAAGLTPDPLLYSDHVLTTQASSLTVANTATTFAGGTTFTISIRDNGTAQAISWGTQYAGMQNPLPTTTVPGKAIVAVFRWAPSRGRWEQILLAQEA